MEEQIESNKESITLTKNAKGDYQWSIKVKDDILDDKSLSRLEAHNKKLEETYGKK